MTELVTRRMTPDDAELIREQRERMFAEAGIAGDSLEAMREPFVHWVRPRLENGSYLGWAVMQDDAAVAGLGLLVLDWPPHPQHPLDCRRGYVLNVYVGPEARGRGLAKGLMAVAEAECRTLGIEYMVLHASPLGRPVYQGLGWKATNEMSISLSGLAPTAADAPLVADAPPGV